MVTTSAVHKIHSPKTSSEMAWHITNHRKIAVQLQATVRFQLEAARHYAAGDLGQALEATAIAEKHVYLARKVG